MRNVMDKSWIMQISKDFLALALESLIWVLLSIWDDTAYSWWLVRFSLSQQRNSHPPLLVVCTSRIPSNIWPHFSQWEVAEIFNWKWWFLFEHSLDFGAKFGDIPIWLLDFPKFSDAQYLKYMWTILHYPSQFGKQPSPSLRSNEKKYTVPCSTFCFPNGQIRSTVQLQATNTRLNVVLATGADLTRRGALIAVRTVGRVMD